MFGDLLFLFGVFCLRTHATDASSLWLLCVGATHVASLSSRHRQCYVHVNVCCIVAIMGVCSELVCVLVELRKDKATPAGCSSEVGVQRFFHRS